MDMERVGPPIHRRAFPIRIVQRHGARLYEHFVVVYDRDGSVQVARRPILRFEGYALMTASGENAAVRTSCITIAFMLGGGTNISTDE